METDVDAELLKICWVPLGFRLTNKYYAAKFHIKEDNLMTTSPPYFDLSFKAGQLHTILTDYECMYYEIADFMKKFSSLNAKLGGPEKTLLEKVRNMFISSTTKVSNENKNDNTLEFDLEVLSGKRILKWHFLGQHLGPMNYVFSHITRPLLNILSVVVDECDLSSVKASVSSSNFSSLFGKSSVQKLYEAVATESVAVENIGSTYSDDESEEGINIDTNDNNHANKNNTNSLPATPPPSSAYEVKMSDTDQDKDFREIQTLRESPPKKPKLRF